MQFDDVNEMPKVLSVYLQLSEYPILARRIREQMREELFSRGVMTREQFDQEVRAKAIASQRKEGLSDPFAQESPQEWADRVRIIRDHLLTAGHGLVDIEDSADHLNFSAAAGFCLNGAASRLVGVCRFMRFVMMGVLDCNHSG